MPRGGKYKTIFSCLVTAFNMSGDLLIRQFSLLNRFLKEMLKQGVLMSVKGSLFLNVSILKCYF